MKNENSYISWCTFTCGIFKQAGHNTKLILVTTEKYDISKVVQSLSHRIDKESTVAGFELLLTWKNALSRYLEKGEY